jgi:bifunctional non-homologous end joining protein LigD
VQARLEPLRRKTNPFAEKPELNAPTSWVEPEVVAEVKYQNWTDDGHLRAPVFLRLRDDIDPKSVRRSAEPASGVHQAAAGGGNPLDEVSQQLENKKTGFTLAVGPHQIRLTHLDRVYWPADPALKQPALTKRDLLRYFAQVSPYILPHLADRPLTMIRMPDGINGQRFFQKHWEQERPGFVETLTVFSGHKDESHDYLLCNNLATLLWLAQAGTLEFHIWHSRAKPGADAAGKGTDYAGSRETMDASVLNYPDYVVFDIDPYIYSGKEAPGDEPELNTVAFEKGKEVARRHREDLGQDRPACLRADPPHHRLRCRAPRLGTRRTPPDAPASQGHHPGMERAEKNREDLHGLQHERARQDPECRLFAQGRCGRAGIDAAELGGVGERASA